MKPIIHWFFAALSLPVPHTASTQALPLAIMPWQIDHIVGASYLNDCTLSSNPFIPVNVQNKIFVISSMDTVGVLFTYYCDPQSNLCSGKLIVGENYIIVRDNTVMSWFKVRRESWKRATENQPFELTSLEAKFYLNQGILIKDTISHLSEGNGSIYEYHPDISLITFYENGVATNNMEWWQGGKKIAYCTILKSGSDTVMCANSENGLVVSIRYSLEIHDSTAFSACYLFKRGKVISYSLSQENKYTQLKRRQLRRQPLGTNSWTIDTSVLEIERYFPPKLSNNK